MLETDQPCYYIGGFRQCQAFIEPSLLEKWVTVNSEEITFQSQNPISVWKLLFNRIITSVQTNEVTSNDDLNGIKPGRELMDI